jgi:hypothetical protein
MNKDIKIAVYFKNREKPIILTDTITNEDTYENKLDFFHKLLNGEEKITTIVFLKDNFIFNTKDIQSVVISKPELTTDTDLIVTDEEDDDLALSKGEIIESKPLDLGKNEDEDNVDDLDADKDDNESVEVVES